MDYIGFKRHSGCHARNFQPFSAVQPVNYELHHRKERASRPRPALETYIDPSVFSVYCYSSLLVDVDVAYN